MLTINKLVIKTKLKLTSSYFCVFKTFGLGDFFYSANKSFFYKYVNLIVFFVEKMLFQLLKILYIAFDILKKNGIFLLLINSLFRDRVVANPLAYILAD